MKEAEKQRMLQDCITKLKRAAQFAESLSGNPVRVENCYTLWTLTCNAADAAIAMKSAAAGNPEPKVG